MTKLTVFFLSLIMTVAVVSARDTVNGAVKDGEVLQKGEEAKAPLGQAPLSGKVTETMNVAGYTYVQIENSGKRTWIAVPQRAVTVGEEMSFQPGFVMKNFTSKTLNRTFDEIVFSGGVAGQAEAAPAKSQEAGAAGAAAVSPEKVDRAAGPGGYTVAELHEKSADLDKKNVSVRGRVTKVLSGIMERNWVHIEDGSGDPSRGTNAIVITSGDLPVEGDVVTAQGTLYKDKDFGSGYKYSVIVEDASFVK